MISGTLGKITRQQQAMLSKVLMYVGVIGLTAGICSIIGPCIPPMHRIALACFFFGVATGMALSSLGYDWPRIIRWLRIRRLMAK